MLAVLFTVRFLREETVQISEDGKDPALLLFLGVITDWDRHVGVDRENAHYGMT